MKNNDLKKMKRVELLEILYQQQQRIEDLEIENAQLKKRVEERQVIMKKTGSIADASLALTQVFQEAQKSADLYLSSIREIYDKAREGRLIDGLQTPADEDKPKGRHSLK
ncbi:MAG: hypothetical protein IKS69_07100 [Erysipelotrichaceae bacterium]|nr:hypothetical protein [Erysipelotrichaceae bacterium]